MLGFGHVAGLALAYAVSRAVGSALVGVTPHDAVTYTVVPAALMTIATKRPEAA